uniref:Elongation factor 1 beta central acidic region eukaryote domain-containing protein n=1 Tax=Panagrolaimus sp. ES5 TaxID=591445 RepID=A0AC34GEL1_9BILA
KQFNDYLATRSYVDGYEPSSRDAALYSHFKKEVNAGQFPHVARWHSHIASFSDSEREKWTGGAATSTASPAKANDKPAAPKGEDKPAAGGDDDFDLFGSDEEDDEEKQRITKQRLADYAAKKSKKPGPIAKSNIIYDICCVVEDDKVSTDALEEKICEFEDLVQSIDVIAFNKV